MKNKQAIAETEEPFLCDDCQKLGYCRNAYRKILQNRSDTKAATDQEIRNWVPVNVAYKNGTEKQRKILRAAHDIFHQGDYANAKEQYQEIINARGVIEEAVIGLAVSLYFLFQFEEAAAVAERLNVKVFSFEKRFLAACENRYEANKLSMALMTKSESEQDQDPIAVKDEVIQSELIVFHKEVAWKRLETYQVVQY